MISFETWLTEYMNPREIRESTVWFNEHKKTCKLRAGAMGYLYSYTVCPTSIGTSVTVHCPCGDKQELTSIKS